MKRCVFLLILGILGSSLAANAGEQRSFSFVMGEKWTGQKEISLAYNSPVEFDFLTKAQVMALRKEAVLQHQDLIEGTYEYSPAVFGKIEDSLPWWGLKGQFCIGPGQNSIEGPSEESRFLLNPFLLLMLDSTNAFINKDPACFVTEPNPPVSATWYPLKKELVLVYDVSRYFSQCVALHGKFCNNQLQLDALNARDFGFSYIYFDPALSKGISALKLANSAFEDVYQLKAFIHLGKSCGYSGGCNNSSPDQPQVVFKQDYYPGELLAALWYQKPRQKDQAPDVTVRFILQ